jgi:EAL domain-containing protein (putative c-di-GMP-specific phosphodiesterase class I)/putative methionine-R-sulfoxide reductase with GAF domain
MLRAISSSSVSSVQARRRHQLPYDEAELLSRVLAIHGEIVQAGLDPHRIVDVVTHRAQELTHAAGAVVEILDGDELVYWSASGALEPELGLRVGVKNSLSGMCAVTGLVLRCDDSETDPRVNREKCRRVALRSMLVAPLRYGEITIGVLKVVSPYVRAFGPDDDHALSLLNDLIGAMLSHAAHHADLQHTMNARAEAERQLTAERAVAAERIRVLIDEDAFEFAFQPIVRLGDRCTVAYEALARFPKYPDRAPSELFDDAREGGLQLDLELALAEHAITQVRVIPDGASLAINVSPETLTSPAIEWLCKHHSPERLILEVTEHTSIDDYDALAERVFALKRLGVRLAIDDAGAGFASLRHVLRLEPDLIKLDASLTHGINSQARQQNLAAALVTFAAGTSASIVAEGIETHAEFETLRNLCIPYGQGYFLGRPGAVG